MLFMSEQCKVCCYLNDDTESLSRYFLFKLITLLDRHDGFFDYSCNTSSINKNSSAVRD
jgi:hypothetical protein